MDKNKKTRDLVRAIVICAGLSAGCFPIASRTALAQESAADIKLPAQSLARSLADLTRQTGIEILAPSDLISGKQAPAVAGRLTTTQVLERLLDRSGLEARRATGGGYVVQKAQPRSDAESVMPEVSVIDTTQIAQAAMPGEIPAPFPGGQVARGGQVGVLGNRDLMDTPFSITSYTAQTAQDQQARTLADVMANDPSVRNFSGPTFPADTFYIRGLQVDFSSFNGLYGVLPLMRTSPAAAERVEVLKGPSALLNGMPPFGGIGGVINVVPKRAGEQPLTQLTGTYASDSQFGAQVDVGRRFGPDNSVGLRFNGIYRDGDTGVEGYSGRFGLSAIGLDFRGESVRISLDFGYQEQKETGLENAVFASSAIIPAPPDASKRFFQPWLYHNNNDIYGALRGEFDLTTEVTAFAVVGGTRNQFDELYSVGLDLNANGDFTELFGYDAAYNHTGTAQAGLRGKFSTGSVRHDVTASATTLRQERGSVWFGSAADGGVDAINSNLYSPNFIAKPVLAPLPDDLPKTSELELTSYALTDVLSFASDRVILVLGGRLQQVKQDNFDVAGAITSSYDEQAVTPAVGIVYKATQGLSLYASFIEGLSQGPVAPAGTANVGQVFPPSKSKQVEAGVKMERGRVGATLAVFQIDEPSGIIDPATNVFSVDGQQRNRGVELNAFGELSRTVRVLGGAMFLDGKLTNTQDGLNNGKTALNAPEVSLNFGAEWDTPGITGLTLSARAIYTSAQFIDQGNTQEIPAWTRFDVGARYALKAGGKPLVLRANIENLFNETYWYNSSLFRGAPLTVLMSATIDF